MGQTTRVLQTSARSVTGGGHAARVAGVLVLGFMACAACAQTTSADKASTATPPAAGAGEETGVKNDVPADLIGTAISDAVRRTGAARTDVKVVLAQSVTWADGSMGCPQDGMTYTQALVPGYRIVLQAAGQTLNYHAGGKGGPTFCPSERVVPPSAAGSPDRL